MWKADRKSEITMTVFRDVKSPQYHDSFISKKAAGRLINTVDGMHQPIEQDEYLLVRSFSLVRQDYALSVDAQNTSTTPESVITATIEHLFYAHLAQCRRTHDTRLDRDIECGCR